MPEKALCVNFGSWQSSVLTAATQKPTTCWLVSKPKRINDKAVYDVFDEYFAHIDDHRQAHKVKHLLSEMLFIAILAIIASADDFNEIARFARLKKDWLATFNGEKNPFQRFWICY